MKKLVKSIVSFALVISLCIPVTALAKDNGKISTYEDFSSNLESIANVDVELVSDFPQNVVPMEFDTWDEAYEWISQVTSEVETHNNSLREERSTRALDFKDGFSFSGEKGSCVYQAMPSGKSSVKGANSYEVPGMSAQTVKANYYFEHNNYQVTSSSASATISGVGFSNYDIYYNELEVYTKGHFSNYYRVILGDLGIFVSVGDTNLGVTQILELDYCLYNFTGIEIR